MPSCVDVFWFVLLQRLQSKDCITCIIILLLLLTIYYLFRLWTSKKANNLLEKCKEKHNNKKAYFLVIFYHYPRTRFRLEGFRRIIVLFLFLSLSFWFGCIWIEGYSFNDQQLYYWVFSTLAQVFGALIGLLVIIISTVILGYERSSGVPLKCSANIKNDIRFSLYPSVIVLLYSIILLSISSFVIKYEFCRVIITIFGMEIPILAIYSLIPLIDIIEECRKEIRARHPRRRRNR